MRDRFNFHSPRCLELESAKKWTDVKKVALILLLASVSMFTACSYITDFVVVNESANPIELRYKIKDLPGQFGPRITPAKMTSTQLRSGDKPWEELGSTQYKLDPGDRTITLRLMPNEALRVERIQRSGMQIDEAEEARSFSIEEISIVGANGEIKFEGERVRKSFMVESKKTYTLTYK